MEPSLNSNGNGNQVVEELVSTLVMRLQGTWSVEDKGILVKLPENQDSELIEFEPQSPEAWATRFRWVEKQVASAILSTPVVYALDWKSKNKPSSSEPVIRVSVGLSLSRGALVPKRYACLWKTTSDDVTVVKDAPLAIGRGKPIALPNKSAITAKYRKMFSKAIVMACAEYRQQPDVQAASTRLGEARRKEYVNLDLLYRGPRTANDRLHGLPPSGTEGSAAVAAELRNLQEVVAKRYAVSIQVQPLTLGLLFGNVPSKIIPS